MNVAKQALECVEEAGGGGGEALLINSILIKHGGKNA